MVEPIWWNGMIMKTPEWMVKAVSKMRNLDKMDESRIAKVLGVGRMQVRAANTITRERRRMMATE